jgi:hypothetical protein
MATLTRDALIAPKTKTVKVDGGEIVIRALRASEAMELRGKDLGSAEIFGVIASSIVEPKLTAEEAGQLSIATMNKIVVAVFAFNKLGDEAAAEAQAELKKTVP